MSTLLFLWLKGFVEYVPQDCVVDVTPWSRTLVCGPSLRGVDLHWYFPPSTWDGGGK